MSLSPLLIIPLSTQVDLLGTLFILGSAASLFNTPFILESPVDLIGALLLEDSLMGFLDSGGRIKKRIPMEATSFLTMNLCSS